MSILPVAILVVTKDMPLINRQIRNNVNPRDKGRKQELNTLKKLDSNYPAGIYLPKKKLAYHIDYR